IRSREGSSVGPKCPRTPRLAPAALHHRRLRTLDRNREVLPLDDLFIFHEEHAHAVPRSHQEPRGEMIDSLIEYHAPSSESVATGPFNCQKASPRSSVSLFKQGDLLTTTSDRSEGP